MVNNVLMWLLVKTSISKVYILKITLKDEINKLRW